MSKRTKMFWHIEKYINDAWGEYLLLLHFLFLQCLSLNLRCDISNRILFNFYTLPENMDQ